MSTGRVTKRIAVSVVAGILALSQADVYAAESGVKGLDEAISSGDFNGYLAGMTAWLNQKVPASLNEAALQVLLKDPAFRTVLDQRQLIVKTGADKLGVFAKADPANKAFLSWLLKDVQAMDLYLEGSVPIGLATRDADKYTLNTAALEIWKKILVSDPDAKAGIYQKMAIATAILPPGSVNIGAGGAKTPADPVVRYAYYKTAHKNGELFPSFDHLTVWEYSTIMCSGASDADLTWGRGMANTMRPDLRVDEMVVNTTSHVWRRGAPEPFWIQEGGYNGSFKNVLAGGGKCGPRSSWSVFICHAFGIPAIGVGQPAHACVAYKAANPMTEPQPGSAWKVGYGRGWQVSKLEGMGGLEFLAAVQDREHAAEFSQVEHLRWYASALAAPAEAAVVMEIAHKIQKSLTAVTSDTTASLKADEAEKELTPEAKAAMATAATTQGPIRVAVGATRIEAAAFASMSGVRVLDGFGGGKQVNFDKNLQDSWVEYPLEVAAAGTYTLTMRAAAANVEQVLNLKPGSNEPVVLPIPNTNGLWGTTPVVEIKLVNGRQTLRVSAPFQRGVAVQSFELKSKN